MTDRQARLTARLSSRSLGRSMLAVMTASGITLFLQLFTGVLNARLLGPKGRGEIEAIIAWVSVTGFVFAFGCWWGLAYYQARAPRPSPSLLSSGLLGVAVLGSIGFAVTQFLIPFGFAEQSDETMALARWLMFGVFAMMGTAMVRSLLVGNNFFFATSLNNVTQPVIYLSGALVLWAAGIYAVGTVSTVIVSSFAVTFVLGACILVAVSGLARPVLTETRAVAAFGLRGYGATLSRLVNVRLDVVLMPAILAASEIGLYAVAISVGSIMIFLFQDVGMVVLNNTVRADVDRRMPTIERVLRLVLYTASMMAVTLWLIGPTLIVIMYGDGFEGAGGPLRLLLPGLVLFACANIMGAAIVGFGRPGRASIGQFIGVGVTVVGLLWSMPRYGIYGAAGTSTAAYATIAVANFIVLKRCGDLSFWRVISPAQFVGDLREMTERALSRLRARF